MHGLYFGLFKSRKLKLGSSKFLTSYLCKLNQNLVEDLTQEEVNLASLVSLNYDYLPPLLSACKTKGMMDQKWKWIADSIDG